MQCNSGRRLIVIGYTVHKKRKNVIIFRPGAVALIVVTLGPEIFAITADFFMYTKFRQSVVEMAPKKPRILTQLNTKVD